MRLGRKVVVKVLSPELAAGVSRRAIRARDPARPRRSSRRTSFRCSRPATTTGCRTTRCRSSRASRCARAWRAAGALAIADSGRASCATSRGRSRTRTSTASSTATSSRTTCCSSGGTAVVTDFGIAKAIAAARAPAVAGATLTQTRHLDRHAGVHGARAGRGRSGHRPPRRHLRVRLHGVRDARRHAAVRRPHAARASSRRTWASAAADRRAAPGHARPRSRALVMRCLEKDADARPQSAAEVLHALDDVTSGGATAAVPPSLARARRHVLAGARALRASRSSASRSSRGRHRRRSGCRTGSSPARWS